MARDDEGAIQRGRYRGKFRRRVGVGQAATDGAAVPDLRMPYPPQGLGEQRHLSRHHWRSLRRSLAGERADADHTLLTLDVIQGAYAGEVDQHPRPGHPPVLHRDQRLATTAELRVAAA